MFVRRSQLTGLRPRQDAYTETGSASTDSLYADVSDVDTDEFAVAANLVLGRQVEMGGGVMRG